MKAKTILIASNTSDHQTVNPVAKILSDKGFDVVMYACDKVAKGAKAFSIEFIGRGQVQFIYGSRTIDPAAVDAAWYRRPTDFRSPYEDIAKELYLDREKRESQDLFLRSVPEIAWLNSPTNMTTAEHKLWQLQLAEAFGLTIPRTIVANSWSDIREYFTGEERFIFKMPYGEISINNQMRLMGAKILAVNGTDIPAKGLPFPGICQQYIPKKREWRVTVVGKQVFAASIHTHEKAKDDWRQHQRNSELVQFKKEPFPQETGLQCVAFLEHLGLKFGAFDFIEDPDGNLVFLEVNPNGQYGWLEDQLGLPISGAIADELMRIAGVPV